MFATTKSAIPRVRAPSYVALPASTGVISVQDRELAQVQGFAAVGRRLRHGERKRLAQRLATRRAAVDLALERGTRVRLSEIAALAGVTERTIHLQFGCKEALFAFPPPELAHGLLGETVGFCDRSELSERVGSVFRSLEANNWGRELLVRTARLRRSSPELERVDRHFWSEFRSLAGALNVPANWSPLVGLFADAVTDAIGEWSLVPETSLEFVATRIDRLTEIWTAVCEKPACLPISVIRSSTNQRATMTVEKELATIANGSMLRRG